MLLLLKEWTLDVREARTAHEYGCIAQLLAKALHVFLPGPKTK